MWVNVATRHIFNDHWQQEWWWGRERSAVGRQREIQKALFSDTIPAAMSWLLCSAGVGRAWWYCYVLVLSFRSWLLATSVHCRGVRGSYGRLERRLRHPPANCKWMQETSRKETGCGWRRQSSALLVWSVTLTPGKAFLRFVQVTSGMEMSCWAAASHIRI